MLSLLFGSIFLALTITHRYLGPMVQIRRHVRSLRDGNYDSIIVLRKNDEFRDIADDLNILAVKLKDIAKS
jgi:signal transduction histidine kinase